MLSYLSCSGIRLDNNTPRGNRVKQFIEFMLTIVSKVTHKKAIIATAKFTDAKGAPIVATEAMQHYADAIKEKLNVALEKLAEIIDPDTAFSNGCDKITGGHGRPQISELSITLPDGNIMVLRLDIDTTGYTPADRDMGELVLETLEEALDWIGDSWFDGDAPLDEMQTWHTKVAQSIHEQLGLPAPELVGAIAGGSGSEGGGIKDADLDS